MKKRILSILLVLCMLLPISAFALGQADGDACFNYLKKFIPTKASSARPATKGWKWSSTSSFPMTPRRTH